MFFVHRFNRLYPRVFTDLPIVFSYPFLAASFYFMRVLMYKRMYVQSFIEMVQRIIFHSLLYEF